MFNFPTPAKAGAQPRSARYWAPAFAGVGLGLGMAR